MARKRRASLREGVDAGGCAERQWEMGKIIRRTATVTITETWTVVWTDDGTAGEGAEGRAPRPRQASTGGPAGGARTRNRPGGDPGREAILIDLTCFFLDVFSEQRVPLVLCDRNWKRPSPGPTRSALLGTTRCRECLGNSTIPEHSAPGRETAKPPSPVQIRAAPPTFLKKIASLDRFRFRVPFWLLSIWTQMAAFYANVDPQFTVNERVARA